MPQAKSDFNRTTSLEEENVYDKIGGRAKALLPGKDFDALHILTSEHAAEAPVINSVQSASEFFPRF